MTKEKPSRPTPADRAEKKAFLGLTPIAKAITKIKTGTNTAALNVVKNMFKALRNASMPSPFV